MAYRRRQPPSRVSTFPAENFGSASVPSEGDHGATASSPPGIAAQAIRASAAHRDASSLSSAYGDHAVSSPRRNYLRPKASPPNQDSASYEYTSINSLNESKYGFWGLLARKAKQFIDDDNGTKQYQSPGINLDTSTSTEFDHPHQFHEYNTKRETTNHKSSDALASSLKDIGGTIKNAIEEGLTKVENKTADILQETRKLNIRRKVSGNTALSQVAEKPGQYLPQIQTDYETQLKASRDVANAMAAKAKLLLRELKTVKADLAFAKERCAQLEEENKMLRESHEKGDGPEDDDLIRLQLETLLSEKARLAHENSVYARENRFLREIVEYHQLTMQDVVYLDEGIEEVSEVYASPLPLLSSPNLVDETSVTSMPSTPTLVHKNNAATQPPLSPSSSIVLPEDCPILPVPPTPPLSPDPPKGR